MYTAQQSGSADFTGVNMSGISAYVPSGAAFLQIHSRFMVPAQPGTNSCSASFL